MMATERQIEANRRNAQKSTGPKDTGKTRYNATFHGLRGSRVVLEHESMDEYNAMAQTLYDNFDPVGTYEHQLVKRIADRMWELERAACMKAQIMNSSEYRDVLEDELRKMERYETSIERSILRFRRELGILQAERQATQPSEEKRSRLVTTNIYVGPSVPYCPSQGEAAVDYLLDKAVRKIKREAVPAGESGLSHYLTQAADQIVSLEAMQTTQAQALPSPVTEPPGDPPGRRKRWGSRPE